MRASIIVVSYNSAAYLAPCLASVLREMTPADELIVVDNASADGSAALVAEQFPQARLLCGPNVGYAGGNNRGSEAARGKFLLFLNPDTLLMPGALEALLAPLVDDVGLTSACVVHLHQPEVVNTCGNTLHYTGLAYCRGAGQPRERFGQACDLDAVSGAACALRRALFVQLGGFDESFFMYVEDTDLSWRARLAGYRCRYVPGALVAHDYRPAYSPAKAFYLERNRHLMLLKHLAGPTYLRLLPGLLLAELVTGGFLLLKGPRYWGVKPRVYRALWAERRAIRHARQASQALRRCSDRELLGGLTHRLEFEQLANRWLARAAALVFHPLFWGARVLIK